jgi:hypothetical protein
MSPGFRRVTFQIAGLLLQLLCQLQKCCSRYLINHGTCALVDDSDHGPTRLWIAGKRKLPTFTHQFRLIHFVDSRHYLPDRHVVFVRRRWDDRPGVCTNGIESGYFHDYPTQDISASALIFSPNYLIVIKTATLQEKGQTGSLYFWASIGADGQ